MKLFLISLLVAGVQQWAGGVTAPGCDDHKKGKTVVVVKGDEAHAHGHAHAKCGGKEGKCKCKSAMDPLRSNLKRPCGSADRMIWRISPSTAGLRPGATTATSRHHLARRLQDTMPPLTSVPPE